MLHTYNIFNVTLTAIIDKQCETFFASKLYFLQSLVQELDRESGVDFFFITS